MIEIFSNFIIHFIQTTGYFGVFVLMTLESALIPLPSEVTMPFAGSLVSSGVFNFWILAFVGALGNLAGSLLAFWLGYLGEEKVLQFIRTKGKYALIREKEFVHATSLFASHGDVIVFVSRLLPAVRTYISLPAGVTRMAKKKFVAYTFIGSLIWSVLLTYVGVVLGDNWRKITPLFHYFDVAVIATALILAGYYLLRKLYRKN